MALPDTDVASPNDGPDGRFDMAGDGTVGGAPARGPPGDGAASPHFDGALAFTRRHVTLALVPFVTALLAVDDLRRTAAADGGLGVHFSFPLYRADLWTFVERPTTAGVDVAAPGVVGQEPALVLPALAAYVVVSGMLTAGYLESIAEALETGQFDFVANVRRYAGRTIALEVLVAVGFAALLLAFASAPGLLVVAVLAGFVAAYFLFPTAYVLVVEDLGVFDAIEHAVDLVQTHQPIGFVLQVAVAVGACSVLLSSLARTSLAGGIAAAALAAPLGLAFNVYVMQYVATLADATPSTRGRAVR